MLVSRGLASADVFVSSWRWCGWRIRGRGVVGRVYVRGVGIGER